MAWFLNLFSEHRSLQALLQVERDRCARTEADMGRLAAKLERAEIELQRINAELVKEAQKVADTMSMHAIGKRIYSKADAPAQQARPPAAPTHVFPRDLRAAAMRKTAQDLKDIWDHLPGPPQN